MVTAFAARVNACVAVVAAVAVVVKAVQDVAGVPTAKNTCAMCHVAGAQRLWLLCAMRSPLMLWRCLVNQSAALTPVMWNFLT